MDSRSRTRKFANSSSSMSRTNPGLDRQDDGNDPYDYPVIKSLYLIDKPPATANEGIEGSPCSPRRNNVLRAASMTPPKIGPNCGRKRVTNPTLIRTTPTSSHGNKMASIFRDAADTYEGFETPSRNPVSTENKFRVPISDARATPFGLRNHQVLRQSVVETSPGLRFNPSPFLEVPVTANNNTYEPTLSYPLPAKKQATRNISELNEIDRTTQKRHTSPAILSNLENRPVTIQYPQLTKQNQQKARFSGSSFFSDCHSSHGVPLVISFPDETENKTEEIDTWLKEVVAPSTPSPSKVISQEHRSEMRKRTNVYPTLPPKTLTIRSNGTQSPSGIRTKPILPLPRISNTSNSKENAPPSSFARPSRPPLCPPSPSKPSPNSVKLSPSRFRSTALSPSPLSPLNHPPRRIPKDLGSTRPAFTIPSASAPTTPFSIHEDTRTPEIKPLSPNVELYRKGNSPKRGRCASYWDDDLWKGSDRGDESDEAVSDVDDGGGIRKGKRILGLSAQNGELTRAKPFVDQAEGARFGFRVGKGGGRGV